ncbi:MAG: N-acetylneuraminate synthase [Candidatus Peregrinibacteria bacterium Greene0416_19]|nr:MAG: N-acetylneuraminate synthase [Candidatus Peregrinibacteria bacterium Greene0416_19]
MSTRVLIIAEIGSVHDGSFGNAKRLIELAKDVGADAVKFQTHIADAETTKDAPSSPYFKDESRYEYFRRTGFMLEQWKKLKEHADGTGIEFLSSPFSEEAVDLLEKVGVARYKVPSGEVTNLPLLEKIAATGKPVILSSGMSSWEELDRAVETIRRGGNDLTVLQCTSEYPCPPEQVGLNLLAEMRERYQCPVGLSDHTMTLAAPIAAVTLGASVIEKHLTFSRHMYGSDAKHSLEPAEFRQMCEVIRAAEAMLHHPVDKSDASRFKNMKQTFEKSVAALVPIKKGTTVTRAMLGIKKPGTGIPAARISDVIGTRATRDIPADTVMIPSDLQKFS